MDGGNETKVDETELESLRQHLKFRQATEKDYEGIMNINRKIYGGWDYLPALYLKYIQDPNRFGQVAELDGEIVSFYTD